MAFDRGSSRYYFLCSKIHFFGMTEIYLSVTIACIFDNMIENIKTLFYKITFCIISSKVYRCVRIDKLKPCEIFCLIELNKIL